MNRSWAIMIAAMLLASCRSSQPTTNPFLRTTVAPPATGQGAVVVPTEPYSTTPPIITTPPPPGPVPVAPVQGAPPAMPALPRGSDKYSPPGGSYMFHQSKREKAKKAGDSGVVLASANEPIPPTKSPADIPSEATLKLTAEDPQPSPPGENQVLKLAAAQAGAADGKAATEGAATEGADSAQSRGHPIALTDSDAPNNSLRIVGDASAAKTQSSSAPAATATAAAASAAGSPVLRITAGEPVTSGSPAFREVSSTSGAVAKLSADPAGSSPGNTAQLLATPAAATNSGVVQATFQPPAGATPASSATSQYAHSADYSELRGRLEYSQTAQQWKLRYIPIDGETDKFGGSVVLSDASLLASYQSGDLVSIRGAVAPAATPQAGFSPNYQVHQIARIGR